MTTRIQQPETQTPKAPAFTPALLLDKLRSLPAAQRYIVAISGGLDSTVLLHALAALRRQLKTPVHAIHVNHGLHPDSGRWAEHCRALCAGVHIPFEAHTVAVRRDSGMGLEAAARAARYGVLKSCLVPGDVLLTAHHLDDQLETFLLMALRGAGPAGLAAMPVATAFGPGHLARPLLDVPRAALRAYAETGQLQWLDDPSNADTALDRNYLRQEVIPRLRARWPGAAGTIARSTRHSAAAAAMLDGLAAQDYVRTLRPDGSTLAVSRLKTLPEARAALLVRFWLERLALPPPPGRRLEQVLREVLQAGADRRPKVSWEGAEIRRYRDGMYAMAPLPALPEASLAWKPAQPLDLPAGLGRLHLQADPAAPGPPVLEVRFRDGGERVQLAGSAHRRPLKKLLQEAGVPPWMRERIPLIYRDGQLVAVGDLWRCEPFAAQSGYRIVWQNRPALL